MSLRRLTFSTAAVSSTTMLRILAQLFVIPVLARFLTPDDYGLVAMAMPFLILAMIFAEAGIGMSLVRTSNQNHAVWSTCFWVAILLGLALALLTVICAPLAAFALAEPRLTPIVMSLSLVIILQALTAIPVAALQQQHRFGTIAAIEIAAMIASIIAAIYVALQGGGAWALVAQQLAHYGVKVLIMVPIAPFRPGLHFNLRAAREHLLFGRDVLGVNLVNFVSQSADQLTIGRVLGAGPLGIYAMAFLFVRLPARLVAGPLQFVTYPYLAQNRDNRAAVRGIFLFLTRALAILIVPGMAMIAAAHEPVFRILLSEKWLAAGEVFMLATPGAAVQAVMALCGTILLAAGQVGRQLRAASEFCLCLIAALLLSVWFGVSWVAVAYTVAVCCYAPRLLQLTLPVIDCRAPDYIRAVVIPVIMSGFCIAFYLQARDYMPSGDWGQIALAATLAVSGITGSFFIQMRQLLADITLLKTVPVRGG